MPGGNRVPLSAQVKSALPRDRQRRNEQHQEESAPGIQAEHRGVTGRRRKQ
jgi:hypothetical protein